MLEEIIRELVRQKKLSILPAVYSTQFLNSVLGAGANIAQNIPIESASHFICRYINIATYTAGLVLSVATPPLLINLADIGSGRFLFDAPQPVQCVCGGVAAAAGQGSLPFIWPEPWLIRAGGTAQVTVNNLGAAAVVRADVSLIGYKVYPLGGSLSDLGV